MPPLYALLSAQPSRAEDTNSPRYGYCQLNNSQQCSEAEASAACQTKLHVSSIVSALHQTLLRLILFTPENKLSLFSSVVVFLKGSFQKSCAAKSADLQNTWVQAPSSASQSKCSQESSTPEAPIIIVMAFNFGRGTECINNEWYRFSKQEKYLTIIFLRKAEESHTSEISSCSVCWLDIEYFICSSSAVRHLQQVKTREALSCRASLCCLHLWPVSGEHLIKVRGAPSPTPPCERQCTHYAAVLWRLGGKFCWVWAVLSLAPVSSRPKLIHPWTDSFTMAQETEELDPPGSPLFCKCVHEMLLNDLPCNVV